MDGVLKLSYTKINIYEKCPLQYKYQFVDELPIEPSPARSFGESLHAALEWFYSVDTPHPPDLESLLHKLDEVWISEGYRKRGDPSGGDLEDEEERYKAHARDVLTRFYYANASRFLLPVAVEKKFGIDMGDFLITGRIDRVDRHPDGTYEIIDYKTHRKLPTLESLKEDLQLPIYQYAAAGIWGVTPGKLTFYYLLPNQKYTTRGFDQEQMERFLERIRSVAKNIEAGKFEPRRNSLCPWCSFKELCPEATSERPQLTALIDRYADLSRRRRLLEGMIEELDRELHELWSEDLPDTIHSERHVLHRKPTEKGWVYTVSRSTGEDGDE
jgi:RecB family exonuclease